MRIHWKIRKLVLHITHHLILLLKHLNLLRHLLHHLHLLLLLVTIQIWFIYLIICIINKAFPFIFKICSVDMNQISLDCLKENFKSVRVYNWTNFLKDKSSIFILHEFTNCIICHYFFNKFLFKIFIWMLRNKFFYYIWWVFLTRKLNEFLKNFV